MARTTATYPIIQWIPFNLWIHTFHSKKQQSAGQSQAHEEVAF